MQCVYLLQEIELYGSSPTGYYKIGKTSKDAESRKRQYQAGNARRVVTLYNIQVANAQMIETELHRQLEDCRVKEGGGDEWFDFREIDINWVISRMNEYGETQVHFIPTYADDTSYSSYSFNDDDWPDNFSNVGIWILICLGLLFGGGVMSQSSQATSARIDVPILTGYEGANLRSAPKNGDEFIIGQVRSGEQAIAYEISRDGQWRRVKLPDGRAGWVANNFVK